MRRARVSGLRLGSTVPNSRSKTERGLTSTTSGVSGVFQDTVLVYAQLEPVSQLPIMRESSQPSWSEGTRVCPFQCCAATWSNVIPARTSAPAVYFGVTPDRKLPDALACPPP